MIYRSDKVTAEEKKSFGVAYEYAWNHTTLRGLRVDPKITYLQVLYPFPNQVEKVRTMTELLGDEVLRVGDRLAVALVALGYLLTLGHRLYCWNQSTGGSSLRCRC